MKPDKGGETKDQQPDWNQQPLNLALKTSLSEISVYTMRRDSFPNPSFIVIRTTGNPIIPLWGQVGAATTQWIRRE